MSVIKMGNENRIISKGQFYFIYEKTDKGESFFILEDKTKRGLEAKERIFDNEKQVDTDIGIIYNLDGIANRVNIRWYFPQSNYPLSEVQKIAGTLEKKYKAIRELTCPDD